jgi:hypothetical protein
MSFANRRPVVFSQGLRAHFGAYVDVLHIYQGHAVRRGPVNRRGNRLVESVEGGRRSINSDVIIIGFEAIGDETFSVNLDQNPSFSARGVISTDVMNYNHRSA